MQTTTMSSSGSLGVSNANTSASGFGQMPLSFMKAGESGEVVRVRGEGESHHHLENLGFVPGAQVGVVSDLSGNMIVRIKDCQVALDRSVASRVVVR